MSKITDLLLARRREIETEIASLTARYLDELDDIDKALGAIRGSQPVAPRQRSTTQTTIPSQIEAILDENPGGLRMRDVLAKVNLRFGRDMTAKNMSWHLVYLRRKERITRDGDLWKPLRQGVEIQQAAE